MALNFKEKFVSIILIAGFATLISYFSPSCNLNRYREKIKKITFNNKEYLGRRTNGLIGSKNYIFVSPPMDISIQPRPGGSFEIYSGTENSNTILFSYKKYENDSLVINLGGYNDPEFEAKQDTLERLIEAFGNGD